MLILQSHASFLIYFLSLKNKELGKAMPGSAGWINFGNEYIFLGQTFIFALLNV